MNNSVSHSVPVLDRLESLGSEMREWVQLVRTHERNEEEARVKMEIEQKKMKEASSLMQQKKSKNGQERIPFRQQHQNPDRHLPPMTQIEKSLAARNWAPTVSNIPLKVTDVR